MGRKAGDVLGRAPDGGAGGSLSGDAAKQAGQGFDKKIDNFAGPGPGRSGFNAFLRRDAAGKSGGSGSSAPGAGAYRSGTFSASSSLANPASATAVAAASSPASLPSATTAGSAWRGGSQSSASSGGNGNGADTGAFSPPGAPRGFGGSSDNAGPLPGGLRPGSIIPGETEDKDHISTADANELSEEEKQELADIQKLLKEAAEGGSLDEPKVQEELEKLPQDGSPALSLVEEKVAQMLGMTGRELTMVERKQVLALAAQMDLSASQSTALPPAVEHGTPPSPEKLNRHRPRWERLWYRLRALGKRSPGGPLLYLVLIVLGAGLIAGSRRFYRNASRPNSHEDQ